MIIPKNKVLEMIKDESNAHKDYLKIAKETGDGTFIEIAEQEHWHQKYWEDYLKEYY
jgi:hypothetical protein